MYEVGIPMHTCRKLVPTPSTTKNIIERTTDSEQYALRKIRVHDTHTSDHMIRVYGFYIIQGGIYDYKLMCADVEILHRLLATIVLILFTLKSGVGFFPLYAECFVLHKLYRMCCGK